jgi:AraC-like DNA-binding protein
MARKLRFVDVCPDGGQLHIKQTCIRGHYRTFMHAHDFWEFFFVTSGTVRQYVNGRIIDMAEHTLCLAGPADEHCFQNGPGAENSAFTNVAVSDEVMRQVYSLVPVTPHRGVSGGPLILESTPPELAAGVGRAAALLNGAVPADTACQRMLAISLAVQLLAELAISSRGDPAAGAVPPWLRAAMRAMERRENYLAGLPVLLSLCGKSQEHVTRTMKKSCGFTPTEFINQFRLREAARLLRDTDGKVMPIVLESGFANMSHFLARFRRRYGCSPRQYRRQQRMVTDPVI